MVALRPCENPPDGLKGVPPTEVDAPGQISPRVLEQGPRARPVVVVAGRTSPLRVAMQERVPAMPAETPDRARPGTVVTVNRQCPLAVEVPLTRSRLGCLPSKPRISLPRVDTPAAPRRDPSPDTVTPCFDAFVIALGPATVRGPPEASPQPLLGRAPLGSVECRRL